MNTESENGTAIRNVSISGGQPFDQLISNFFDILVLIDERGCQHYVSSSCEKILGYKPDELTGVPVIDEFIHPDDQEETREGLRNIINNSANGGAQYRHRHKNGGWVYLEAFGTNQLDNPSVRSVVLNVRDITERKKTEQELRESKQRLKELNATKDRFLAIIGHDLKNPVCNIVGLSDLMLEQLGSGDHEEIEGLAKMIHQTSKKTMDLLSNLLTWAQAQTGSIQYQPESVDLKKLADEVVDLLGNSAGRKSIRLENFIPEGTELSADPGMIQLIIRNLVSNGIKFTPVNGTVSIRAGEESDKTTISVEDTGVGISGEGIEKLFRTECHYSTKGTRNEDGTGLGLLLCKEFVERHGGDIRVDSQKGQGSTFSFTIPRT